MIAPLIFVSLLFVLIIFYYTADSVYRLEYLFCLLLYSFVYTKVFGRTEDGDPLDQTGVGSIKVPSHIFFPFFHHISSFIFDMLENESKPKKTTTKKNRDRGEKERNAVHEREIIRLWQYIQYQSENSIIWFYFEHSQSHLFRFIARFIVIFFNLLLLCALLRMLFRFRCNCCCYLNHKFLIVDRYRNHNAFY